MQIIQAVTTEHKNSVKELFREYLTCVNLMASEHLNIEFNSNKVLEQNLAKINQFMPPDGQLLIAKYERGIMGCAGLQKIGNEIAEVKRVYVRSPYRKQGIGRLLLKAIIEDACQIGYAKIRLDSAPFMQEAQALYRSLGFREIEPYPESEIPENYRKNWIFMEKILQVNPLNLIDIN